MPTYVSLVNWTEQGVRTVKDTVNRRGQAEALAQKHGVKFAQVYWTVGPYDIVTVADFPDDESATAFLLAVSAQGNIRTTTLRAYTADQMTGILGRLG